MPDVPHMPAVSVVKSVLKVAIFNNINTLFDYLPPALTEMNAVPLRVRVRVPLGNRTCIGIVVAYGSTNLETHILKNILEILDNQALFPDSTWNLLLKAHQYYHHSLGDVFQTGLPVALRKGKGIIPIETAIKALKNIDTHSDSMPELNSEQREACDQIKAAIDQKDRKNIKNKFTCFLLEGITGSGKTEVYLRAIQKARDNQKTVLILIPEIALTPQLLERFEARFTEPIGLYHSQMTDKQRLNTWSLIYHQKIHIIIGTRSALFLPIQNLGLIILDEEHDMSFKQQDGFKYSARDMAVLLAQQQNVPIVLGSATPSFESVHNANLKKYHLLTLSKRAGNAKEPELTVLDIRHKKLQGGLSRALISELEKHLKNHNQVLIFLNRRGYAPAYMCFDCGWFAECDRCDRKFTYHKESHKLKCHHCEYTIALMQHCKTCSSENIKSLGIGTEKLEETLQNLFPDIIQVRIDKDTTARKGALQDKLHQITEGNAQILIGTQLLAKGHHFPNVTLVAIIDVDGGLFSTDFRAVERMGQLITQVAGRAGRGDTQGKVILQTCHPDHFLLKSMLEKNYRAFSQSLLEQRQACDLPPFSHFALLRAASPKKALPERLLTNLKFILASNPVAGVSLLGPVPAPIFKRQNYFYFQLLIQSSNRAALHQILNQIASLLSFESRSELAMLARKLRFSMDVDPLEMA